MPVFWKVRVVWMRPPSTRVWLFRRTTEVSASRFRKRGELIGGGSLSPTSLFSTACVMELPVLPPADTGTCCEVTMGTEVDTLMTAFLFSLVMMDGLESTLTLFSVASAFKVAMNSLAARANMLKPGGTRPPPKRGPGGVGG